MSIRFKLLLSYAAMLIVPLVLMVVTAALLLVAFRGDLQNVKNVYESKLENVNEGEFYRLIQHTIAQNPSLLSDPTYLDDLSEEMRTKETYLITRSGNKIVYVSEGIKAKPELLSKLPAFGKPGSRNQTPIKSYGNDFYAVSQFDFTMPARGPESLFLVNRVDPIVYFARKFFPVLFISLLVILILTHTLLTYFMSKNIIRPLRELQKATGRIKQGDLDFQVEVAGKDEIGQLGVAFEEMRSQLQHSIRLQLQYEDNRKELISNISHDLKTPLTAIQGYVDGILDGVADSQDKADRYMRTISNKAAEMDNLIDELFLYSKLDLKSLPYAFETIPIKAFLSDWVEDLRFELDKKGVRLDSAVDLNPAVKVSVDRDKFRRVLSNIIQNSVKYMDKDDKRIALSAVADSQAVTLKIEDNGAGIDAEALPFIFDRFYRAEQSRNSDTGGSGLGLAIAKQIMEGHGGDIQAESGKGQGTRIFIRLPIRKEGQVGQ